MQCNVMRCNVQCAGCDGDGDGDGDYNLILGPYSASSVGHHRCPTARTSRDILGLFRPWCLNEM